MNEPEPVLLLTAWHFPRWHALPRRLLAFRRLERRSCRAAPGCVRSHRWLSRRSLLLSSWWTDRASAERWLASEVFTAFDRGALALGARPLRELHPR